MSQDTVISLSGLKPDTDNIPSLPSDFGVIIAPKPLWQRAIYPPRLSVNGLLIGVLFSMLAALLGFTFISIPSPFNGWLFQTPQTLQYTPQLSWLLMTGALLGPFMGPAAILLFLVTGLFFLPLFANGGGWQYIFEPGFGYLLATLPAGFWLARSYHKALQKTDRGSRSLRLLQKAITATLAVHGVGNLYILALSLAGLLSWHDCWGWLFHLSLEKLPYDLLATIVLLGLVRQIRLGLWLVLY
jgi:biotin transport system substrate-specific component